MDRELIGQRIHAAMADASRNEMQWSADNCAFWVSDILAPIIGIDLMAPHRGKFRSRKGCYRYLGKSGLRGGIERLAIERGWSWVPPERADIGDVGIAGISQVLSTVICLAPGWFVGRTERGFAGLRHDKVLQAWSVK